MPQEQAAFISHTQELLKTNNTDLLVILGPTATGKSDLALILAQELQIPIINCDSRLIYDEMNIGTAKPNAQELASAKHYLINIRKPNEQYSAGEYKQDFDDLFSQLPHQESQPKAIMVGGTGLYIDAALDLLALTNNSSNPELRNELQTQDLPSLQKLLLELDSQAASSIDINNPRRIIRAIELLKANPQASLQSLRKKNSQPKYPSLFIGLNFKDRETLYSRINSRVLKMIEAGLENEVKSLYEQYGAIPILQNTIGYSDMLNYLDKQISLDEAIALIQKRSRNYAKRQLTWFKARSYIHWFYYD